MAIIVKNCKIFDKAEFRIEILNKTNRYENTRNFEERGEREYVVGGRWVGMTVLTKTM